MSNRALGGGLGCTRRPPGTSRARGMASTYAAAPAVTRTPQDIPGHVTAVYSGWVQGAPLCRWALTRSEGTLLRGRMRL